MPIPTIWDTFIYVCYVTDEVVKPISINPLTFPGDTLSNDLSAAIFNTPTTPAVCRNGVHWDTKTRHPPFCDRITSSNSFLRWVGDTPKLWPFVLNAIIVYSVSMTLGMAGSCKLDVSLQAAQITPLECFQRNKSAGNGSEELLGKCEPY